MHWKYTGRWPMMAPADSRTSIQGRWTLQSFEMFPQDTRSHRLKATLIYDDEGNVEITVKGDDETTQHLARALEQPRHWQLTGQTLTLTTLGHDGRPVSVAQWKKES